MFALGDTEAPKGLLNVCLNRFKNAWNREKMIIFKKVKVEIKVIS